MKRIAPEKVREYRKADFLAEVEPRRLQLIGAIALAWNWIEGGIDTALCMCLELKSSLWIAVGSRINGIDGKLQIIRESLNVEGLAPFNDKSLLAIKVS